MDQVLKLTFASSLTALCEANASFDSGVLRVAYHGENRNRSVISKETFERCIKSMYNCPIVCNYNREDDSLGGHDVELVHTADGGLRLVNVTEPVGVIPESASYSWQTVTENDGTEHEYLFVDVLLWKRQEAYRKIKENGVTSQSMEITVKSGELKDGLFYINDFEFTAFTLIGVEPCFESASLVMFSQQEFEVQMHEMMLDMKKSFSMIDTPCGDDDIHPQISAKGGEKVLEEKMKLAADYGIDVEKLDFSMEDMSIEELTEKFEAMKAEAPAEETEQETAPDEDFALACNIEEELRHALGVETIEREWGIMPKYCMWDFDPDLHEVYAWDHEDWLLYGFEYTVNGDAVTVRFDTKKRMKIVVAPFEGEQESPFAPVFAQMGEKITANAEWEAKYRTASETIQNMETELSELRSYKATVEANEAQAKRDEIFARFEDLNGNGEFEALRGNCADLDIDALEEKCFALRGRFGTQIKFSYEPKAPKFVVDKTKENSDEPYGGLVLKYGHCSKD